MKRYNRYIGLFLLSLGLVSCDVNNELDPILEPEVPVVALNAGGVDFSNYVAVGASFTAGYTDGALFKAGQENSFPNILASKFSMAGGGSFEQPLMEDNIGGLIFPTGQIAQAPRFYFNPATGGPARLSATPNTVIGVPVSNISTLNNFGVPGAKSFHLVAQGYGSLQALSLGLANPYYVRMASAPNASVLGDAMAQNPTFFTLSEVGGNDVLGYALSGGDGSDPITPATTFDQAFGVLLSTLTSNGTKGVVGNVPYITNLANFTTVPYNPLDPSNPDVAAQIPLLNTVYGAVNQIYAGAGQPERAIIFSETDANPVVIYDEDATDLTVAIATTLGASPTFIPFVQSLGLPAQAAPLVAQLLGQQYGKARSATENDLLVLASSAVIGEVNSDAVAALITQSGGLLPANLAGQFSVHGVTLPLADRFVLTPQEQAEIKMATDSYNTIIETAVASNPNAALVDLNGILAQASTTGVMFDGYNMTTSLVTGGLVSLDGVHLTSRGYALMANEMLLAIDAEFGSNFGIATNGLAKADNYPTNYSPALQ